MRVLVTGGAGFIGSHVCEKLIFENHEVVCIDNFNDFYSPEIKRRNISGLLEKSGFHLSEGDILDNYFLQQIFSGHKFDVVIHLAARAGVRQSLENPELYARVNVLGTLAILEKCREHNIKKIIFASSSSVYGNLKKVPFLETDNVDFPISPYAATKKSGELVCFAYHHLFKMDIACLRFFTVYGPRQRPEMAIHKFIYSIMRGEPIELYGDGTTSRDYTYIDDIVRGIYAALQNQIGYEIINLGNSYPVKLYQLVSIIERCAKKTARIIHKPQELGDVEKTYADISKAQKLLGWRPRVGIEEGVQKTVERHTI